MLTFFFFKPLYLRSYNDIEIYNFIINVCPEMFPVFLGSYRRTKHNMSTTTFDFKAYKN